MLVEIGHVEAIFRYPVKSMGGERLEVAQLGWHGLDGDRRLAFRRMDDRSGLPWLTAGKLPDLLLFAPQRREGGAEGDLPTHIRTPDGVRCSMVNLDPDSASPAPEVLKAIVRANQNNAGIYGAVTRIGRLAVGQTMILHATARTIPERRGPRL
jgi:uncharacterized protein YcbX